MIEKVGRLSNVLIQEFLFFFVFENCDLNFEIFEREPKIKLFS